MAAFPVLVKASLQNDSLFSAQPPGPVASAFLPCTASSSSLFPAALFLPALPPTPQLSQSALQPPAHLLFNISILFC